MVGKRLGLRENRVYRPAAITNRRISRQAHEAAYCHCQIWQEQLCVGRESLVLHRAWHSVPEPVCLLRHAANIY